jgi:hypothetical protein
VRLLDGDGHPLAIAELEAIVQRPEPEFAQAVGALIARRRAVLRRGRLDRHFHGYRVAGGPVFYETTMSTGAGGISAVFAVIDGALMLMSVVAFDSAWSEAMRGAALAAGLKSALERLRPRGDKR